MRETPKKEQSSPFLPVQHAPIRLPGEQSYSVNNVPFIQADQPITFLHTHEVAEFGICLGGNGIFIIGGEIDPFCGGDCTFIPAWTPHLAQSAEHTASRWYWLSLDPARMLVQLPELSDLNRFHGGKIPNLFPAREYPEENRLIGKLFETAHSHADIFSSRQMTAYLTLFSIELHRRFRPGGDMETAAVERIRKALDFMLRHYADPLDVGTLAETCCLSANQFRRVFQQATGKSPQGYWNALRIAMAASMLRNGTHSLGEIAAACGYPTLSSFNRQFRKQYHASPGRFRKIAGTSPEA